MDETVYLFVGDSLTEGRYGESWVERVAQVLNDGRPGAVEVVNAGRGNETVGSLQDRFGNLLHQHRPDWVILAVGALQKEPVVSPDGALAVGWRMRVTLTCDHRVVDGATGARFLVALRRYMEHPALLSA